MQDAKKLIEAAEAIAAAREETERAGGKVLTDNPVAVMRTPPTQVEPRHGARQRTQEEVILACITEDGLPGWRRHRFETDAVSYLTARRRWDAFREVRDLLTAFVHDTWVKEALYKLFHWTYGVLTLLRRYDREGRPHILVGVRGDQLAGRNVGEASFPGGMVRPGESLHATGPRELLEEGGRSVLRTFTGFTTGGYPDTPHTTFLCLAETDAVEVGESYEWKGGRAIWVPETDLILALEGTAERLVDAFRRAGIHVPDRLKIAGDAAEAAVTLLDIYPSF